jgi:hypothetical protein
LERISYKEVYEKYHDPTKYPFNNIFGDKWRIIIEELSEEQKLVLQQYKELRNKIFGEGQNIYSDNPELEAIKARNNKLFDRIDYDKMEVVYAQKGKNNVTGEEIWQEKSESFVQIL